MNDKMNSNNQMQETRRLILEILRQHGQATVDALVQALVLKRGSITSVTVRHHLAILQEQGYITVPEIQRRSTRGRPQHVYMLTQRAYELMPNNYQQLAGALLQQLQAHLPAEGVNVILEGVADSMIEAAGIPDLPLEQRMQQVIDYLNQHGYSASWEFVPDGVVLHTFNCPYHALAVEGDAICAMDMRLIASLVGAVPRRLSHMVEGGKTCSYFIPIATTDALCSGN